MRRVFSQRRTILLVLVCAVGVVAVGTAPAAVADDHDTFPAAYHGEATIDGEPAPAGVTIDAVVNGELRGQVTVADEGVYAHDAPDADRLVVSGSDDDEGATVEFHVHGDGVERTVAEETVTWESGDVQRVNLSFGDDGDGNDGDAGDGDGGEDNDGDGGEGNDGDGTEGSGDGGDGGSVPEPVVPDDGPSPPLIPAIDVTPAEVTVGEEVVLSASGSIGDGEIASYEWTVAGQSHDGAGVTTTIDEAGEHTVELAIEDETGQRETTTETVTVTEESDVESSADGAGDGDSIPGFGGGSVVLALAALLVGIGAYQRQIQ